MLLGLIENHESAVRATLITLTGTSLDEVPFSLCLADAWAVLDSELNRRGSIIDRAMNPELSMWDMPEVLLRKLIHAVEAGNWIAAGGRKSGNKFPKPIPLPDDVSTEDKENLSRGEGISLDEAEERLKAKYSN